MISLYYRLLSNRKKNSENGFTLLELLIAMVIFLIVTGSIYTLMQLGMYDRNRASRRTDVLKNARVAVRMIGNDVLNAGLGYNRSGAVVPDNFNSTALGVVPDVDGNRDMLTSIVAGNGLNQNNLSADPTTRTDMIAFAYRDMDFNGGSPINLQGVAAVSGSPSTPRITASTSTGAAAAQLYDLYLVESDTSQVLIMATGVNGSNTIDAAVGDPLSITSG